jgi:magnesium transporter
MSRKKNSRTASHKHTRRRHHDQPGTAPGTLSVPEGASTPVITVIAYNDSDLIEQTLSSAQEIPSFLAQWPVTWINIDGLGSIELLDQLGQIFKLHPLALEDVSNLHHRSKAEDYDDYFFIITHMMRMIDDQLDNEQLSIFIGKKFILTLQEREDGDILNPVRERLRRGKGRLIRKAGADHLGYAILDATVDGYFPIMEHIGDHISLLEDDVIDKPDRDMIAETHRVKRDLRILRQAMWPMRETISNISGDNDIVTDETRVYLRDCRDHVINIMDLLEIDRERASGLIEIYLSSINNQMNETIKVLTIISTIFIPLSFIAGVYGMNFDTSISSWNMPELKWAYGYPFALGIMAFIALLLLGYFSKRGWIRLWKHP